MKHKITFELENDKQLQKLREFVEPNVLTEESLEPLFHALEEYEPPVEPLKEGDMLIARSWVLKLLTPLAAVFVHESTGEIDVYEKKDYQDGLKIYRHPYKRRSTIVIAPWPKEDT